MFRELVDIVYGCTGVLALYVVCVLLYGISLLTPFHHRWYLYWLWCNRMCFRLLLVSRWTSVWFLWLIQQSKKARERKGRKRRHRRVRNCDLGCWCSCSLRFVEKGAFRDYFVYGYGCTVLYCTVCGRTLAVCTSFTGSEIHTGTCTRTLAIHHIYSYPWIYFHVNVICNFYYGRGRKSSLLVRVDYWEMRESTPNSMTLTLLHSAQYWGHDSVICT